MNKTLLIAAVAAAFALPAAAQQGKSDSPASSKSGAQASQGTAKQDGKFLREIAEADLAEVVAGKLAAQKASSGEVKKFAEHMVEDHGKGLKEGESMAKSKGMELPSQPAKKHQAAMKKLEKASGQDFDRAYMQQMVKDHEETLKKLREASKSAKDPDIKAAAEKKAPDVEKHLQMAKELSAKLGGKGSASRGGSESAPKERPGK